MCDICHCTLCPSGCPNAEEPKATYHCDECESPIYEGDYYYNDLDFIVCEDCMKGRRGIAGEG